MEYDIDIDEYYANNMIKIQEEAENVCKLLEKGYSNKKIADKLNVTFEFVRSIKRGRAWKDISKKYNIPKSEKRNYYNNEFRNNIRKLIDQNFTDLEIAILIGIDKPTTYGRKYINKIRQRYNKQNNSTTINNE